MQTTIKNACLSVVSDTHGAELHAIDAADGTRYLWDADKKHWGYHAPTLFPNVGSLRGDRALLDQGEVRLDKHGFARKSDWELLNQTDDSVTYRLESNDNTRQQYPFDFCFDLTYKIEGCRLDTIYSIRNTGDRDMPFTVGGHPGFRLPMTEEDCFEDYVVSFEYPETADCPNIDENGLIINSCRNRLLTNQKSFSLNHVLFRRDALIFDALRSRSVRLYSSKSGKGVQMDFKDMNFFAIWTPDKDAPFVCLEPWTGTATLVEEDDVFAHKQGTTILAPGETKSFSFSITVF